MSRPIHFPTTLCLLLALAGCASTDRLEPDSATADQTAAAPAEPDPAEAQSRADDWLAKGKRLQAQGRCREALPHYGLAALEAGPARGQALAATYLCHWQLQRPKSAEESFTLLLRHELEQGRLPLRLLFQPGEARYLADARISAPYGMWLRRIADAMLASRHCLTLNGHAGPSPVEQYAAELPLRRAQAVQRQLETLAPALKGSLKSLAVQPDEPTMGSASDDLRDALDRRVEFAVGPC